MKEKKVEVASDEPRFSKEQILLSGKYRHSKTLLKVALNDTGLYTTDEVEAVIASWKGED